MAVIDVWTQLPGPNMLDQHWMATLKRWTGRDFDASAITEASLVAAMDSAGVDLALVSAWSAPGGALISNADMLKSIEVAPDRLKGLASADLARPMDAVRELREIVDGQHVVGVRVVPWLWDLPPNDRRYYPIYAACVDLGVPFCTQIGHTGPLMRSETGRPIPYLEDVLLDFPELTLVGGHVGFPWVNELVSLAYKFPNFFVDVSAYRLGRLPDDFVRFMKGVGRDRVMFATNWPMVDMAASLGDLDRLGLDAGAQELLLGATAQRAFNLQG
jgi:predicted TIM-barrel fold metal-dependent hydrolase